MPRSFLAAAAFALAFAISASGGTFIVPDDARLADEAALIAIATARDARVTVAPNGIIATETIFSVEEVLKGDAVPGAVISVVAAGGSIGGVGMIDTSSPRFPPGARRLLFLQRIGSGASAGEPMHRFSTSGGLLGSFAFHGTGDGATLARDGDGGAVTGWDEAGQRWEERPRRAREFLEFVRTIAAGRTAATDSYALFAAAPRIEAAGDYPGSAYVYSGTLDGIARPIRVPLFDSGGEIVWKTGGSQGTLDGPRAAMLGAAAWSAVTGVDVHYRVEGTTSKTARSSTGEGDYAILFNDPSSEIAGTWNGSSGVLAATLIYYVNHTNTHAGETFWDLLHADVVIQDGIEKTVSQGSFNTVLTHELGHGLGIRHSDNGTPSSNAAVMTAIIGSGLGSNLQPWDLAAVKALYVPDPCTAPSIASQPQSASVAAGSAVKLAVEASGAGLTYRWYSGSGGSATTPIDGAVSATLFVRPSQTTTYRVRVSANCGMFTDSAVATVTVVPPRRRSVR